ncbi:MAG TPA: hypothetical protein VGJ94_17635 [Syntrophorhabdaceae bacterium]|jgi:hypothetical protein
MKKGILNLYRDLTSKKTWQRVDFFLRMHDPGTGIKSFEKGDYLPLAIVLVLVFGAIAIMILIGKIISR